MKNAAGRVSEATKLVFAGDAADGLLYLSKRGFVHRDVAARNVLVSSELRAKISDFGLSRDTENSDYYTSRGGALPVRWTAPEALESRKFSTATDVWAYGVLLYEIWADGATPYDGWGNQKVWVEVSGGYRMPMPENCTTDVYKTMLSCWEQEPSRRPNFQRLTFFFRVRAAPDDAARRATGVSTSKSGTNVTSSSLFTSNDEINDACELTRKEEKMKGKKKKKKKKGEAEMKAVLLTPFCFSLLSFFLSFFLSFSFFFLDVALLGGDDTEILASQDLDAKLSRPSSPEEARPESVVLNPSYELASSGSMSSNLLARHFGSSLRQLPVREAWQQDGDAPGDSSTLDEDNLPQVAARLPGQVSGQDADAANTGYMDVDDSDSRYVFDFSEGATVETKSL